MPFAAPGHSWRRLAVITVAAGATLAALLPGTASAAPATSTAAQVAAAQAKLDQLGVQADKAVEAYDQAQHALAVVAAQVKAQQAVVAQAKARVADARAGLRTLAVAEYENGPMGSTMTALLFGDSTDVLQKADLLARVNDAQTASLTRVVNANRQLESAQARAGQSLSAQRAAAAKVAAQKAAAEKAVQGQQQLAASLETKLKQEQHAAAAAAAARAAQLSRLAASRDDTRTPPPAILAARAAAPQVAAPPAAAPPAAAPPVASSGGAAAALRYAYAQLGKPYQFGGAGPNSFDCSGLTMRAWGAAGVSLSHSSSAQQHQGRPVSLSALQPGDLVFWGNPAYHVGIYVGGGRVLDAPHTGTVVKIQAIWGQPSSAVRP